MSPSYRTLPTELLGRVAELVHEQDLAFAAAPFARAENSGVVNMPGGTWSYWHGRGIRALVQVDRRSRASAVAFLYQSITQEQTSKLYFRFHVLGERLGDSVYRLDIGAYRPEHAASLACALRKLPNLSSLKISWQTIDDIVGDARLVPSEDLEALRSALRRALGKVTSLEMDANSGPALLKLFKCVDGSRLRKLHWAWPSLAEDHDVELERALSQLVGLVELEISATDPEDLFELRRHLRFPTVRSVVLDNAGINYEESLDFAHHLAPSLVRLTILNCDASPSESSITNALPSPLLPTLESLIIEANSYIPVFHQLNLVALKHFTASLSEDCDVFPLNEDAVPFYAAPLRTMTLALRADPHVKPSKKLLRRMHNAGVRLIVEKRPMSAPRLHMRIYEQGARIGSGTMIVDEGKLDTVLDVLGWARRRAEWLYDVEDGPGLHELAQATARLHERFLMDRL